ncbi:uncharacterized protein LOC132072705 [Ammospiza nelsoni]|uniref:uncharacterized protein LOC132072705 n=1 Tax=Ammospiza nelsoni TaxID=2857394 RepID=UPI00286C26CF|nr:uncharacterized protein LOC132072705 [Ammospiza nelsoni]
MAELPLPAGLSARNFPAKLWRLVNSPRVRSVRWDSRAQGLLIDRSLLERELLSSGRAHRGRGHGPAPVPHTFRATQFLSFVRQLYRYGFRKRRSAANRQRPAAGRDGRRRPPRGSQHLPGARPLPDGRHGHARFTPLPRERPPLPAGRPPCGFHLLHRKGPLPARREGPSRFRELYGERPPPAEREVLGIPPCHLLGLHGERLLPLRREGPRSRSQELCREQLPPAEREVLAIQPCSFQQLHREQQPPACDARATPGTSESSAPAGSAACAAWTASSSAQNTPGEEEWPPADLGLAVENMIREIRRSLSERSPSAQDNVGVAPDSSGGEPVDRASAEEASSGTENCRNSSQEPKEPDAI